jgi:hypothetical protein
MKARKTKNIFIKLKNYIKKYYQKKKPLFLGFFVFFCFLKIKTFFLRSKLIEDVPHTSTNHLISIQHVESCLHN